MKTYIQNVVKVIGLCWGLGVVGWIVLMSVVSFPAANGWLWGAVVSSLYFMVLGMHGWRLAVPGRKSAQGVSWFHTVIRLTVITSLVLVASKWQAIDLFWVLLAIVVLHPLVFIYFWRQNKRV